MRSVLVPVGRRSAGRNHANGGVRHLRIAMIGQRQYGSREGGVDVVVTALSSRLAARGHDIVCYDRKSKSTRVPMSDDDGGDAEAPGSAVQSIAVRTLSGRGIAALSSSLSATLKAIRLRPDVIHYHAEGPCVPLPLAHAFGIPTVATIHGLDWDRAKWGVLARAYIKLGERAAAKFADSIIVLSKSAQRYFLETYGRGTVIIPNGVEPTTTIPPRRINELWQLDEGSYLLFLGRIVPEKGVHYLVEAFGGLLTDKRLVIAGDAPDSSNYFASIVEQARGDKRVVFPGFVEGDILEELYSNAYAYVLPSDLEGMPISLLEAMCHGRACVTSDIPECVEVLAGTGLTFSKGSVDELHDTLERLIHDHDLAESLGKSARSRALDMFGWAGVVERTVNVYKGVI